MKKCKSDCDLQSCMFCKGSLKEWLPAVDANRKTYEVRKGEVIFNEGDPVTAMYFVVTGAVKVHKQWGDKELIIRFAKDGLVFGHRALCKDAIYPISATAIETSTICIIDIDFFLSSLKVNHGLLFDFMLFFAEELKVSEDKMRNMAHMPVKGRIASALLALQQGFGIAQDGSINLKLSRQDLASYAGTTYETVFRILNELSEQGMVMLQDKNITLADEMQLLQLIDER
jgi:CRP-like cAMP-binding protein